MALVSLGWKFYYFSSSAWWIQKQSSHQWQIRWGQAQHNLGTWGHQKAYTLLWGIPTVLGAEQDSARNIRQSLCSWQESVLYIHIDTALLRLSSKEVSESSLSQQQVSLPQLDIRTIPKAIEKSINWTKKATFLMLRSIFSTFGRFPQKTMLILVWKMKSLPTQIYIIYIWYT